jgi:LPXTG-motif cell wall-anchored protein
MTNEISVSGQLGIEDSKVPIEKPERPRTSGEEPQYVIRQQSVLPRTRLLPSTGDLQAGGVMLGLLCLILLLVLRVRTRQKSKKFV